jgi:uncharacterized membrane protein YfcA
MSRKSIIMLGMIIGSFAGGYMPILLGADAFSLTSLLGSGAGGILGIWLAYILLARSSGKENCNIHKKILTNQSGGPGSAAPLISALGGTRIRSGVMGGSSFAAHFCRC